MTPAESAPRPTIHQIAADPKARNGAVAAAHLRRDVERFALTLELCRDAGAAPRPCRGDGDEVVHRPAGQIGPGEADPFHNHDGAAVAPTQVGDGLDALFA